MQANGDYRRYSASDVVGFVECEHVTTLDLVDLAERLPRAEEDESAKLVQEKGIEHEKAYLATLRARGLQVTHIGLKDEGLLAKAAETLAAMKEGVDVVYQATLIDGDLIGYADFLVRVERPSGFGAYGYEVWDTKLSRSPKSKFVIQLAFYSQLLAVAQGVPPEQMHVVLGDQTIRSYRCADYSRYFDGLMSRFFGRVRGELQETYPDPCNYCELCKWEHICSERWVADDHLSQVANISRIQIGKLESAGIETMAGLADVDPNEVIVPKMDRETLGRLRAQAALQVKARATGEKFVELLPLDPEKRRGFYRMPEPDPGDMFFDMEGNPWEEGGLEYLFGVYLRDGDAWEFKGFWAHDRAQERVAFEQFIDFVVQRLVAHPGAHVYHYAKYEETALKRLMTSHGTRESDVDNLLRHCKLVDLYQVVREGIRVSEPRYSIKNIEHFYLAAREGEVTNAGSSIVWYERWRETRDQSLLDAIETYNIDDVRSTQELRDWLLTYRPATLPWASPPTDSDGKEIVLVADALNDAEARLVPYRKALFYTLPADRNAFGPSENARELTYQLLDFHRRADKPVYWALFARMDMTEEELREDGECLAALTADAANPPRRDKRSIIYTYVYPEQETKLRTGVDVTRTDTAERLGKVTIDADSHRVMLRLGEKKDAPPARFSIGPGGPINAGVVKEAIFRYANSVVAATGQYRAVESVLRREPPRIVDHADGTPLIAKGQATVAAITDVVLRMDETHLFIQGPPGAGKTYTGSHLIVSLLQAGKRVGVTSNSHKPIHNLLEGVVKEAANRGYALNAVKKATDASPETEFEGAGVANVFGNDDVFASGAQLVAGTAWLFSDPGADQMFDYLFVDEAGQVALANLVAIGTNAKNLILLGDQMQLAQPIQGTHPGRSGESSLDYLLGDMATIPAERGIFLETTWRMHPDVCRFISDAVYDSRLEPEPRNERQVLQLTASAHPLFKPSGIVFAQVEHVGCSQKSAEEAELIRSLYENALTQRFTDKDGVEHAVTMDNILVVAPYNMQVNHLKETLPEGARVGTVDKFQGQEAEIVLISMTTSSEAELPRNIEFLFSKNRLNVAISRAKSLAVLVANPALTRIRCSTPQQMALVNTLCWVAAIGSARYK